MKKLNVIWIVVDSVRTYRSNIDDRDRIAIMDKLGEESIEFTNAITGAPSSILSAASMFTGLPSVFISRHFNDWSFNKKYINSIVNTLKESGYSIYSILNSKEERRVQKNLVFPNFLKKQNYIHVHTFVGYFSYFLTTNSVSKSI